MSKGMEAACGVFSPSALQAEQEESRAARLTIGVTADSGWDGESTPAIAHVVGEGVDFYHAINPDAEGNKGASTVELTEGDYTVSLISPLNRDGSAYELYGTSEEQQVALADCGRRRNGRDGAEHRLANQARSGERR